MEPNQPSLSDNTTNISNSANTKKYILIALAITTILTVLGVIALVLILNSEKETTENTQSSETTDSSSASSDISTSLSSSASVPRATLTPGEIQSYSHPTMDLTFNYYTAMGAASIQEPTPSGCGWDELDITFENSSTVVSYGVCGIGGIVGPFKTAISETVSNPVFGDIDVIITRRQDPLHVYISNGWEGFVNSNTEDDRYDIGVMINNLQGDSRRLMIAKWTDPYFETLAEAEAELEQFKLIAQTIRF